MQFQTLTYLFFLLFAMGLYWSLPEKWRKPLLLVASFVFYCWFRIDYGFLLLFVICNHFFLTRYALRKRIRWPHILAICNSILLLLFFKYLNLFLKTVNQVAAMASFSQPFDLWKLILPLGISFFVFQALSYTVDCMRDEECEVPSFIDFALYIVFWPQLVAGPIMRVQEMVVQFGQRQQFAFDQFKEGWKRILEGLFLKLVISDQLAYFVNEGFRANANNSFLDNWSLSFAFGFQIYFDFAGYSSIAIGSALLFGYRLTENFNFPYSAENPREFWKRWHISLSSWIRDYLYLPLMNVLVKQPSSAGGIEAIKEEEGKKSKSRALFLSWAIMGLWHGANWTFLLWGLWHAAIIFLYRIFYRLRHPSGSAQKESTGLSWKAILGIGVTLLLVMPGWIFFRAQTVGQAMTMMAGLVRIDTLPRLSYWENYYIGVFLVAAGYYMTWLISRKKEFWAPYAWFLDPLRYAIMLLCILAYSESQQQFIYFQF